MTTPTIGPAAGLSANYIDHPSGYLALSNRNQRFTVTGVRGFVAHRNQGKHLIGLGGVHAEGGSRAALLDALLERATADRLGVVMVQVPEDQVALFRSRGFVVNPMGATFAMRIASFSLAGSRKMKLRNKLKRAREQGVQVVEIGRDVRTDQFSFEELAAVSNAWLAAKKKKELDFMIGELGGPEDRERRIFAAKNASGRLCAFITYVPVYGRRPGYLHDLTRKLPDAPVGVMELCNAAAIERFRQEGVEYLHLGFTPFVRCETALGEDSRFVAWLIRMLERHGEAIYPTRSQADYKLKWGPDVIAAEFVAFKPLSLRAVADLMILTRSI